VWSNSRPAPYLRAVPDASPAGAAYCAGNRSHRWSLDLPHRKLAALLGRPGARPALEVLDTTPGGRVAKLRLAPAGGGEAACPDPDGGRAPARVFSGEEWRRLLGLSAVKSLRFEVRETGQGIELAGRGFGHGVGLCQHGSNGRARAGADAESILRHYYTGIEIGPLPSLALARARFERTRSAAAGRTLASRRGKPAARKPVSGR
jgi:stage II sporulation protein D